MVAHLSAGDTSRNHPEVQVFWSDRGNPAVPGVIAGEDDDRWLPGDVSTFSRNLMRVSIVELEEESDRKALLGSVGCRSHFRVRRE